MPKAELTTGDGLHVVIEGSSDEVSAIVSYIKSGGHRNPLIEAADKQKKPKGGKTTLSGIIMDIKAEGFFDTPKRLSHVLEALEQKGHFFRRETVSTALIRKVKNGDLGRIRESGQWVYVKR